MDYMIATGAVIGLGILAAVWAFIQHAADRAREDDPCGPCDHPCLRRVDATDHHPTRPEID